MSKSIFDVKGNQLGTLSELREVNASIPGARAGYDAKGFAGYFWTPEDALKYSPTTQLGRSFGEEMGGFFFILTIGMFAAVWCMNLAAYRSFKTKRYRRGLLLFTLVNSLSLSFLLLGVLYGLLTLFPSIAEISILGYIIGGIFVFTSVVMPVAYIFIIFWCLYLVFVKEVHRH